MTLEGMRVRLVLRFPPDVEWPEIAPVCESIAAALEPVLERPPAFHIEWEEPIE